MLIARCWDCGSLEGEIQEFGAVLTKCSECGRSICTDCACPAENKKQVVCRACHEKLRSKEDGKEEVKASQP